MVTYYNKKDLISFGKYLMSKERRRRFFEIDMEDDNDSLSIEERLKHVHHADIENWKESRKKLRS